MTGSHQINAIIDQGNKKYCVRRSKNRKKYINIATKNDKQIVIFDSTVTV